jgi:hypothetical protein
VIETLGSLNLPVGAANDNCSIAPFDVVLSSIAAICTGPAAQLNLYALIGGLSSFIGPDNLFADSASGIATALVGQGMGQLFGIDAT